MVNSEQKCELRVGDNKTSKAELGEGDGDVFSREKCVTVLSFSPSDPRRKGSVHAAHCPTIAQNESS